MSVAAKDKIILFDIDNTILNNSILSDKLEELVSNYTKIELSDVKKLHANYINSLNSVYRYYFPDFARLFKPSKATLTKIIKEYKEVSSLYEKFPDVLPTITRLKTDGYRVGIFSEGIPVFQHIKLKNFEFGNLIEDNLVFISQSKRGRGVLNKLPKGCYIVDDSLDVIKLLVMHGGFNPVHLDRGVAKSEKVVSTEGYRTINSLNGLFDFLP